MDKLLKEINDEMIAKKARALDEDIKRQLSRHMMSDAKAEGTLIGAPYLEAQTEPPPWRIEDTAARQKYLDDTQNMRVVALNEACNLVRGTGNGKVFDPKVVMSYARVFADFLIEGKT